MSLNGKTAQYIPEQLLAAVFFLYMAWYREIWGNNVIVLYGSVALLTGCVLIRIIIDKFIYIKAMPLLLKMFVVYFFYSFLGVFVAKNVEVLLSSVITFGCFVVVCFDCWYVSSKLRSNKWIFNILKLVSLICACQVIFAGKPYNNGVIVTTMSSTNNPNVLGLILVFGILSFAINMNFTKTSQFFITAIADGAMLYGIILTGSRKCLLVSVPIILYWLYSYTKTMIKEHKRKQLVAIALVVAILAIGVRYAGQAFQGTAAFERLTLLFQDGGTDARTELYRDAVEYFMASPIIGIGFGQYRLWSPFGYYSHSSYAEILSCGGIIGVLIFFVPIFVCLCSCLKQLRKKQPLEQSYRMRMATLMLFCELFLGLGQIFIYDVFHLLLLTLISIEIKQNRWSGVQNDSKSAWAKPRVTTVL